MLENSAQMLNVEHPLYRKDFHLSPTEVLLLSLASRRESLNPWNAVPHWRVCLPGALEQPDSNNVIQGGNFDPDQ